MVTKSVKDVLLDPVSEGVVLETTVSHYLAPANSMSYMENFNNDTLGVLTSRRALINRWTPAATPINCTIFTTVGPVPNIVWQEGTSLKFADATGINSITTYTSVFPNSTKNRFDTVQNQLLMTATLGSSQPKYTNLSASPVALSTSFPTTVDLISAGFIGRIWTAYSADTTNKVYYSDVIPSAGVTSTTGGTQFLTINANAGDYITGFARTQQILYVFTHNGIFRIYNTQSQDNTPITQVGAFSQEGIVKAKDGFYFYHPSGIFKLGDNGSPQEISIKIRSILEAVKYDQHSNVFGWADDDHVYFSLGNNLQSSNLDTNKSYTVRYTISTQVWTVYSFYDFLPLCAGYANPSRMGAPGANDYYPLNYILGQNNAGSSFFASTLNLYNQLTPNLGIDGDLGLNKIYLEARSHFKVFGLESHLKRISGVAQAHENAASLNLDYQVDKDKADEWKSVGSMTNEYVDLFTDFQSKEFNRIKFRFKGVSNGNPITIGQTSLLQLDNLGYKNN